MKQWLIIVALLAVLVISAIQVVNNTRAVRALYSELARIQHEQDQLLESQSRLMIERGAVSSFQNVERTAAEALSMRFPESVEQIAK